MLRALFCALPAVALVAHAQGEAGANCESLPESRRALCLMVQACTTLADDAQRLECFRMAAQSLVGDASFDEDESSADIATGEPEPTVASDAPKSEEGATASAVPALEPAPIVETPRTGSNTEDIVADEASKPPSRTRKVLRELFSAPPSPGAPAIPKRFTAEVTAHHDLVRDRQLVVLDGALLFEGDNAASSRISVGDEVEVVKSSSMRGRRYQIMGPSKRRFDALRIRCEANDLNVDNRRKCERMIGR